MDREEEFSELYYENYDSIRKYVSSMMGQGFMADDIVQETFLEAWRKYDIVRKHPNKGGWLMRTACFKMRNLNKKVQRQEVVPLEENLAEGAREEYGYEMKELELFLDTVLNEEERVRFRRFYLWGYTAEELSMLEGITENNARVRICRLLNKLRKEIMAVSFLVLAANKCITEFLIWGRDML